MEKGPERRETLSGPYVCFLIFFSPFYCSPHPSLARTMPTKAHEGPEKPTQAHEDGKRARTTRDVVWAVCVFFDFFFSVLLLTTPLFSPDDANKSPRRPTEANASPRRRKKGPNTSFGP